MKKILWALMLLPSGAFAAYPTSTPTPAIIVGQSGGAPLGTAANPLISSVTLTNTVTATAAPTASSQTVSNASVTIFAANADRKGLECRTLDTNTLSVFVAIGAAALVTDFPIGIDSYWSPAVVPTGSVTAIAASGSQVIRCLEW